MAGIGFEAPHHMGDLVALINRSGKWQLTVIDTGGHVYGHYEVDYGRIRNGQTGPAVVYDGDLDDDGHALFTSETDEGVVVFLHGMYLGQFGERSLESIQDDLLRRKELFV